MLQIQKLTEEVAILKSQLNSLSQLPNPSQPGTSAMSTQTSVYVLLFQENIHFSIEILMENLQKLSVFSQRPKLR